MSATTAALQELLRSDAEVPAAENRGDSDHFQALLAPAFAMRRRNGDVVDRDAFLDAVKAGGSRELVDGSTRTLVSEPHRTLVASEVRDLDEHGDPRLTSNLRLYVRRSGDEPWRILAWANEPA